MHTCIHACMRKHTYMVIYAHLMAVCHLSVARPHAIAVPYPFRGYGTEYGTGYERSMACGDPHVSKAANKF